MISQRASLTAIGTGFERQFCVAQPSKKVPPSSLTSGQSLRIGTAVCERRPDSALSTFNFARNLAPVAVGGRYVSLFCQNRLQTEISKIGKWCHHIAITRIEASNRDRCDSSGGGGGGGCLGHRNRIQCFLR